MSKRCQHNIWPYNKQCELKAVKRPTKSSFTCKFLECNARQIHMYK